MSQSLPIEVASVKATNKMQDDTLNKADTIVGHSKMLQDDLQKLGLKIKHHEDNLKFLKTQTNNLDESIFDMQVSLGKYHSSTVADTGSQNLNHVHTEQNTIEQILRQEKTAAGILCQLKTRHGAQASNLPLTKDVLGIVATLGKVNDDNHSRFFSEYLGLESMLAVVCKTYEGVKALELYDQAGRIDKSVGLHGLGQSIGRPMDGRFRVICLEDLIPYAGKFVAEDPQKKLALLKPRLPSGECPSGFLGFAVNMIHVDNTNLSCLTPSGHGLRETLFYYLFSHLQVYRTRVDMQLALPCISDGAISLDGGMMKGSGVFDLGNWKDVEVRFPITLGNSNLPGDIGETAERIKLMKWEKERIDEDIKREETLLNHAKNSFDLKRQEFVKFLGETSPYVTQNEVKAERK
ncbi:protein DEFECTIVE IN MERISTEM SILENCING 3-like isoform X2 [Magnolia sinica]|nr:protein DEFECTIVE IN MERISTEM SILENCING 3-like isoform X2 [Magnolia sinica]